MSSLTRSKPSFIIYRDEPVEGAPTQQPPSQPSTTVTSPRLTISTSFASGLSLKDKENAIPYSATEKSGKNKGHKLTRSLSAPTSPIMLSDTETTKSIRLALATKFVAPSTKLSKPKSSSTESSTAKSKSKSKSSSSSSKRAVANGTSSDATPAAPKLKRSSTSPSPSSSQQKKRPARKASILAPLPEEGSGVLADVACGSDGLTMADRKARDLTQLPLGDISEAFPTSLIPEGFTSTVVSRKRTRAHSINARDDQTTSVTAEALSPASAQLSLLAVEAGPSSSQSTAVVSNASPHKRVRLSPLVEATELPALSPLPSFVELPTSSTQETVVDVSQDFQDELDVEAVLIGFASSGAL